MKIKLKTAGFICFALFLAVGLIFYAVKRDGEKIIQGEVETQTFDLSSKVTGRVSEIKVKKGDKVNKGDVLIVLDTPEISAKSEQTDAMLQLAEAKQLEVLNGARSEQKQMAQNALNQAKSGLELAEKTYGRMKRLHDEGVVSAQKTDEVYTQYKNAQKAYETAKANFQMYNSGSRYEDKLMAGANVKRAHGAVKEVSSYLNENKIKAPVAGEITQISVEEGELAGAGFTLITVVNTDDNWVVLNLREDLLPKIKIGTEFNVKIPALGKENIRVKVNYIAPMGNFTTWRATKTRGEFDLKTFEIHAKPVSKVDGLRAGMSVIVDWNKVGKD